MISMLLVDDEELVRTGLRMILDAEPDLEVAGEAADGDHAVARARALRPDVVLMDVQMPRRNGIDATRILRSAEDPPAVVMLTTFDLDEHVYAALEAGACGFLLKDVPAVQLVQAIRVAAAGEAMLAPAVTRRLIARFSRAPRPRANLPPDLTPRETEVLRLLAEGLSNAEVADRLVVGEATVKTHVARILTKCAVRDRVQAVVLAYRSGLVG